MECILEPKKWPKSIPRIESQEVAIAVANALIQANFFHRSEKVTGKKGYLRVSSLLSIFTLSFLLFILHMYHQIAQSNVFDEKGYYTWMFAGNMMWSNIATFLVIAAVIGFTLLPIWPDAAKKVLWYCSVTFLLGTTSFCLVRALLFVLLWLVGYDFWIFPRLFDESLSFQDSFKPVYSFERGSAGQGYYRLGLIVALAAFVYWAVSQPTEFDGYIQAQKDFIDDLYSGKLLSDVPFDPKDGMAQGKKVRSLEDLLRELEADEKSISETAANEDQEGSSEPVESVNLDEDGGNEEEETVTAEGDN